MRPRLETVTPRPDRSFHWEERTLARFDAPWHFHPEIELTSIISSRGRRFVGDSIEPFGPGDLVLLGPNLPHFWHNEEPARQRRRERAHSVVLQFRPALLGDTLLATPELATVRRLLDRAARGLSFSGPAARRAALRLRALGDRRGATALGELLLLLDELARARSRPIATETYSLPRSRKAELRLGRVFAFLNQHFREPLTLPQIARVAGLTPEAFSRSFKRMLGRNVTEVLTELRIDYAARCLVETDALIGSIALESGFSTLSSFNRQFLRLKRLTPRAYRGAFDAAESDLRNAPAPARFAP